MTLVTALTLVIIALSAALWLLAASWTGQALRIRRLETELATSEACGISEARHNAMLSRRVTDLVGPLCTHGLAKYQGCKWGCYPAASYSTRDAIGSRADFHESANWHGGGPAVVAANEIGCTKCDLKFKDFDEFFKHKHGHEIESFRGKSVCIHGSTEPMECSYCKDGVPF